MRKVIYRHAPIPYTDIRIYPIPFYLSRTCIARGADLGNRGEVRRVFTQTVHINTVCVTHGRPMTALTGFGIIGV